MVDGFVVFGVWLGLGWVGLWAVFIDLMNLVWKGYVGGVSYGCVGFCVCVSCMRFGMVVDGWALRGLVFGMVGPVWLWV